MRIIEQLVYKILGDSTDFNREIDNTSKKFSTFGNKVKKVMAGLGITVSIKKVIDITKQAVEDFAVFETSLAKTSTLFGDVAVDTDNLSTKIFDLSSRTGLAADAIGESLYNALSAGIPVTEDMGEALAFMESNSKLATAGFTDMDTAVSTTAKILNAYRMEVGETDRIHTILMQTQNKGITTVGELGQNLAKVTPTAAAFGVAFEDVGASLATMTAQGIKTEVATTYLSGLISELGKQGTTASVALLEVAEANGMTATSMQDMLASGMSLGDVIQMMTEYANDNNMSIIDMFGSLEAGKAALAISGDNITTFNQNLAAMSTKTDVVGDAFNKMQNTVSAQSLILKTQVKNLGIAFGQSLEGPVSSVMGVLNNMIGTLTGNRDATTKLKEATSGLVGASNEYGTIVNKLTDDVSSLSAVELAQLQARKAQLQLDVFTNLKKQSEAYEELLEVKEKNNRKDEVAQGNLEAYSRSLQVQAKNLGMVNAETATDAELTEYLTNNVKDGSKEQRAFIRVLEGRAEVEGEIATRALETAAAEASRQAFIAETAALVADGTVSLEQYKNIDKELYDQIMAQVGLLLDAYPELKQKVINNVEAYNKEQEAIENRQKAIELAQHAFAAYDIENEQVLNGIIKMSKAHEDSAYWAELNRLATEKLNEVLAEKARLAETEAEKEKARAEIIANTNKAISDAEKVSIALGDAYDLTSSKAGIFTSAIETLIESGLEPSDDRVQTLIASLQELGTTTEGVTSERLSLLATEEEAFLFSLKKQSEAYLEQGYEQAEIDAWKEKKKEEFYANIEKLQEAQTDKAIEEAEKVKQAWTDATLGILGSVTSIWGSINQVQDNQNDAEIQRIEEQNEATIESARARGASEEELTELEKSLQADLNETKNQYAQEEAERQKAVSTLSVITDTARAIMQIWADPLIAPWGKGLWTGLAAGAGAAQIAAINSAPMPSYDVGSIRIPETQTATVHKDEMILTAPQAEQARREGITIAPNKASGNSVNLVIYLDGKEIARNTIDNLNSGSVGTIRARVVK